MPIPWHVRRKMFQKRSMNLPKEDPTIKKICSDGIICKKVAQGITCFTLNSFTNKRSEVCKKCTAERKRLKKAGPQTFINFPE